MNKCIRLSAFAKEMFVDQKAAEHASQIMAGIMTARSPRLRDIAATIAGQCRGGRGHPGCPIRPHRSSG
jgi:hypothetical protein